MKKIAYVLLLSMFLSPIMIYAETTSTNAQIEALLLQIQNLKAQLDALNAAKTQLNTAQSNVSQTINMIRSLRQGMSGDDVTTLQTILASDPEVYPEGIISGFYGNLTSEAVKRFQKKNGIETLGLVGPKTLSRLNERIRELGLSKEDDDHENEGDEVSSSTARLTYAKRLCATVPPGHTIAPGWLKKNGEAPVVPSCQTLPSGITNNPNVVTPPTITPDTAAPVISLISASSTMATSTSIVWTTNELSTSKVWFGTSTPLVLASSTMVSSDTLVLNHSISLTDLASSTTYYYIVVSKDASGNIASSSEALFITPNQ